MSHIAERLQGVRDRIAAAAVAAGRQPAEIGLLAVSKTFPADAIAEAHAAGQIAFGENYVQEAIGKIDALRALTPLEWHMIGPLQSNKTAHVAAKFAWVHSVDRLRIAERLSAARPADAPPLSVCVQVNISAEESKSGVTPDEAPALAAAVAALPGLRLRGLMGIAEPGTHAAAHQFATLRRLYERLRDGGLAVDTLSMGMSADLEIAIAEGSTLVRVGTAIFGERT